MNAAEMARDLRAHVAICEQMLQVVERENQSLREPEAAAAQFHQARKSLLPRLEQSLTRLKQHRVLWQRLTPAERQPHPEIAMLIRSNQDLISKILTLDRENEQFLLRRGLLPANRLPAVQQQRPHFVADLYRRNIGK